MIIFRQTAVWEFLSVHPLSNREAVANAVGITAGAATVVLWRMKQAGRAIKRGSFRSALWSAGKHPVDGRGKGPNVIENLKPKKCVHVPQPATELERCWGFFSTVLVDEEPEMLDNFPREGAPI